MGNTDKASTWSSPPPEKRNSAVQFDQKDGPGRRFGGGFPKWAGALGVVLAVAFISLVPNLVRDPVESEDDPEPPTVITLPAPVDADIPPMPTETSLGVFEWTKLVGGQDEIPLGDIYVNPFGEGYLSYSDGSVWLSPDGESWAIVSGANLFRAFSRTTITGRWARAYKSDKDLLAHLDAFLVFQVGDSSWVPVALPDPVMPEIEGMSYLRFLSQPVESGSVVVIPFSWRGSVPWENYGVTLIPSADTARGRILPEAAWDPSTETLVVSLFNGDTSSEARLRVQVEANRVDFTDAETNEKVHTLIFEEASDATSYAQGLMEGFGLWFSGAWVSSNGSDFSPFNTPWSGLVPVMAVPDGGFAAYEGLLPHRPGDPPQETRVWTSRDGITWEDRGMPEFENGSFDRAEVTASGPNLLATVYQGDSINYWLSKDGLAWADRSPTSLPPWAEIHPTDFGFAAIDFSVGDQPRFWVSADGEDWEAIRGPTSPPDLIAGRTHGAAGELIFHARTGAAGPRILWIGRLVP